MLYEKCRINRALYVSATDTTMQDPKNPGNTRRVIKEMILED
jgi:hypothetical protein